MLALGAPGVSAVNLLMISEAPSRSHNEVPGPPRG